MQQSHPYGATTANESIVTEEEIDAVCDFFQISVSDFDELTMREQRRLLDDYESSRDPDPDREYDELEAIF